MKTTVCLVLLLLAGGQPAAALDEAGLAALLEATRAERRMPGLRAAVRYPDGRIVRAAVGVADKDTGVPLDNTIGMPGGSTGKTFVAALAMLLVEEGKLNLDDPAMHWLSDRDWYGRLPNSADIEVRHLLSHSAGLRDYPGSGGFTRAMIWRVLRHGSAYFEPEELIRFVRGKRPLFPAGEGYRYTDAGYLVLGRLLEAAGGDSYYAMLERRILDPQQLTQVRPQNESIMRDVAIGYNGGARAQKRDGRMKFDPRSEWTGGGLITNPTMLVEFYGALAEGRIVSRQSLQLMLDGGWQDPLSPEFRYGYGLFVFDDGASFGHGGLWPGYRTYVLHYRDSGITVAVQTNRDGRMRLRELVERIAALATDLN